MDKVFIVFYTVLITTGVVYGAPVSTGFPGTIQDLPYESRMEIKSTGYQPFESSNAYQSLNIVQTQEEIAEQNPIAPAVEPTNTEHVSGTVTSTQQTIDPNTAAAVGGAAIGAGGISVGMTGATVAATAATSGATVSYTPSQTSTNSDTMFCDKHTNNDANIIRTKSGCGKLSGVQQSRCEKCINHAGTYENGRCFIEVLHWFCQGTGWDRQESRSCPDNYKYQGCGMIRKYVDAEQPFTCPKEGALSGCCQHGGYAGAKHPPFNLDGKNFYEMNCKMPLSANTGWRVAYSSGSAIRVTGVDHAIRNWCMPNSKSAPWNDYNQKGGAKHCATTISGGTTLQQWHKLN